MKAVNTTGRLFFGKTWVSPCFQVAPGFAFLSSVGVGGVEESRGCSLGLAMFRYRRTGGGEWRTGQDEWSYKSSDLSFRRGFSAARREGNQLRCHMSQGRKIWRLDRFLGFHCSIRLR